MAEMSQMAQEQTVNDHEVEKIGASSDPRPPTD
jgi:hypothetical protein